MSTISSLSSSESASYATALAQTSKLGRELNALAAAIQKGDLTNASTALSTLVKSFSQYGLVANNSAAQGEINRDFKALSDALSKGQADVARSAWTQLKSDLASANVINFNASAASPAQVIANSQLSANQSLVSALFGTSPGDNSSISTLLGSQSSSSSETDVNSLVSHWMTYKVNGAAAAQPSGTTPSSTINTTA